ncbi:MAG: Y-family DNA polymerase [Pseudomonadota bacterium]|nr:Y-family DNA polymerase [Pseudomonadota bacterium]
MYALVDCNNFFVSCERVFRPALNNRPVIVLSSNDGCAVARSNEAKALGIQMGAPVFKITDIVKKHNVECISGNLSFYGEMSRRVMSILRDMAPAIEVYSVDEAFLDLSGIPEHELKPLCQEIRKRVLKWTGIPVSIGIAPTKTLAKASATVAKKYEQAEGVYLMNSLQARRSVLQRMDVGDVWGVGRKLSEKFTSMGLNTAWKLAECDPTYIRELTSVVTQKTVLELQGTPCYGFGEEPEHRKQIISSRSFGKPVTDLKGLKEAVSTFVAIAATKLREENTVCQQITVYARTNRFKGEFYGNSTCIVLDSPTNHTGTLTKAAMQGLKDIYRTGKEFKKAGICLGDITPQSQVQPNLFTQEDETKQNNLMKALDSLNGKWGKHTLRYATSNPNGLWKTLSEKRTQAYTSSWDELLRVG